MSIHMRFPMNTYAGEKTSQRKQSQRKVSTNSIWHFFFKWRSCIWSDVFFRVTNSTRQLLFMEQLFLQRSYFFWRAPFPEQLSRFTEACITLKIFPFNIMTKYFEQKLLSQGSINQDYLSKNIENFSFWKISWKYQFQYYISALN